jgi:uncharacterized protein
VKISGSYTIDAPREQVWAALNDIEVLARVVPGCERLDQVGENEFEGQVKIGIQSIRGTYSGKIRLEDIQPPTHYKLVASGKSANGVVDGAGTVDLEEQDGKTLLRYGGDAQIGGVLASVGQRLIEGASRQLINQSLKALAEQVAIRSGKAAAPVSAPAAVAQPAAAAPSEPPHPPAGVLAEAAVAAPTGGAPAPANANGVAHDPERAAPPPAAADTGTERRSVVVPPHEQLKPESIFMGVMQDFVAERPWSPWVIVAFLLGYVLGLSRRK